MKSLKNNEIDEKFLIDNFPKVVDLLLFDNTTKKNIIWATNSYKRKGYHFNDNINTYIIGNNNFIKPRSRKTKNEQAKRSKDNAEVFTPSWICNKQNNLIDNKWFGKKDVFNTEVIDNTWITNDFIVEFPENKTWLDYVKDIRIEITCGEAPYIVA